MACLCLKMISCLKLKCFCSEMICRSMCPPTGPSKSSPDSAGIGRPREPWRSHRRCGLPQGNPCGSLCHRRSIEDLSKTSRTSIGDQTKKGRRSIEDLSKTYRRSIHRTPIDDLSEINRTPIEDRSTIDHRSKLIEYRSRTDRISLEDLSNIYRIWIEDLAKKHRIPIDDHSHIDRMYVE